MLTGLLFSRALYQPSRVTAGMRAPIGQWGPVFAHTGCVARWCIIGHGVGITGCVAYWCVIGHSVGVMAAHGVSLGVGPATSLPTHPPHPSPSRPTAHPTHPLYYQY